jgi:hypothetical protein
VIGDPDAYDRISRYDVNHNDLTGGILNRDAHLLRHKLPLTDEKTREALEMTSWLTSARRNPSPARLVLAQRVLEQVAKWAGRRHLQFVDQNLRWPWLWAQIDGEVSAVGLQAVLRMPGHDGTTASAEDRNRFLEFNRAIVRSHGSWPRADPDAVLAYIDDLVAAHRGGGDTLIYLEDLQRRLASGAETLAWMDQLSDGFDRLRARAKRTRNAVVHGGPLLGPVAGSVTDFQDWLASQALRWALEARLTDQDVRNYIDARTERYLAAQAQLKQDTSVSQALRSAR